MGNERSVDAPMSERTLEQAAADAGIDLRVVALWQAIDWDNPSTPPPSKAHIKAVTKYVGRAIQALRTALEEHRGAAPKEASKGDLMVVIGDHAEELHMSHLSVVADVLLAKFHIYKKEDE